MSGHSLKSFAVGGTSTSGIGVAGVSDSNYGVRGTSTSAEGVVGISSTKGGVLGMSTSGDGTGGIACDTACGAAGIVGIGRDAGDFEGNVVVSQNLVVNGLRLFHIDHPLDPANKYLNHAAVESNEVLNVYSGNITTGLGGEASVMLPEYFSALNGDFRYQLTVIGQLAQAIVAREIESNIFVIKTDKPSVKVSWQVIGVRRDAWVKNHPLVV